MPTFAITNTSDRPGFVDALVRRELKRRIVAPFERATITVDEVVHHAKCITVQEVSSMDTEPRETDDTPSTPPTSAPDATGDSTPSETPSTPQPEGD